MNGSFQTTILSTRSFSLPLDLDNAFCNVYSGLGGCCDPSLRLQLFFFKRLENSLHGCS